MTNLREFRRTKSEDSTYGTTPFGIFTNSARSTLEFSRGPRTYRVEGTRQFLTHYLSRNYNFGVETCVDTSFTCYRLLG
jgi:hypothetical protein